MPPDPPRKVCFTSSRISLTNFGCLLRACTWKLQLHTKHAKPQLSNGPPTYPGLNVEDEHGCQVDTPSPSPIHHGSQQVYPGKGMAIQWRRSLTSTAWATPQRWRGGQWQQPHELASLNVNCAHACNSVQQCVFQRVITYRDSLLSCIVHWHELSEDYVLEHCTRTQTVLDYPPHTEQMAPHNWHCPALQYTFDFTDRAFQ